MKYKIIVDSASDLLPDYLEGTGIDFAIAPLSILIGDQEFIDDAALNPDDVINAMNAYRNKTSSSCPPPETFKRELTGADAYFIVTISSGMSGTYNSALLAAEGMDNVCVIDTLSVCGEEILCVDELVRMIQDGLSFTEMSEKIQKYVKQNHLLFVLQTFDHFVANGRVSKLVGIAAKTLRIKLVCGASEKGQIDILHKVIGNHPALRKMVTAIGDRVKDFENRTLIISHCKGAEEAEAVRDMAKQMYPFREIRIMPMRGLCSYYAMERGVIICF